MHSISFHFCLLIGSILLIYHHTSAEQVTPDSIRLDSSEEFENGLVKDLLQGYRTGFEEIILFFSSFNATMAKMDTRFTNLENNFNALNSTVNQIKQNNSKAINRITEISGTLKTVQGEVRQHGSTTTSNIQSLANKIESLREIAENQRTLKAGLVQSIFLNSKSVSSVLDYSKTLGTELEKNTVYSGLVTVMMWQSSYSWTIHEACQIYKIPQLHPLKSQIPENIKIIFSEERKAIQTRQWSRRLAAGGGITTTRNYDSSGHKQWKFFPTDDCNYFVVKNMETNNVFTNAASPNRGWNHIMSDIDYHWKIILQSSGYYKFINMSNNKAVTADDAGNTFFSESNGDASQDWELKQ